MVILPLTALAIVGVHLYLVQKHEISVPQDMIKKYGSAKKAPSMPFVPHFLLRDMVGWYLALGILAALAALFPWELGAEGRSLRLGPGGHQAGMVLPLHVSELEGSAGLPSQREHPWIEGETLGILFFGFLGLMVALVPFLDRGAAAGRPRRVLNFFAALTVAFCSFHDRSEHDRQAPAGSTRQDPASRCRQPRGNPREGNAMKKLLFLLTPALLLVWAVLPGSAEDKKAAAAAETAPAEDAKSPPSTPATRSRYGCGKDSKPAETKPAETKPAAAKMPR